MKRLLVFLTLAALAVAPRAVAQGAQPESACGAPLLHAPVLVGMTDTAAYFPKLKGLRVAVLANHTAAARFCEPARGKSAAEAEQLSGVSAGEAAAIPLPSEDTTPPVTNTYLVITFQPMREDGEIKNLKRAL